MACHAMVRKQVLKVDVDDNDDGEHDCDYDQDQGHNHDYDPYHDHDLNLGIESTIFDIAHHWNKLLMGGRE